MGAINGPPLEIYWLDTSLIDYLYESVAFGAWAQPFTMDLHSCVPLTGQRQIRRIFGKIAVRCPRLSFAPIGLVGSNAFYFFNY